ncbi:hypothetical protein FN846DRAFT_697547 [Sphaerosporella brunnea]|uniref:Uncharacterized protein n=1 Tax=Sphaerosporella brunnea TaxID=1250544 RepID=A0A5J5EXW9_9PEZI|nr:hypothetical protein FN846DRAFT_697547 [Sphaerosporella brunnea]
MCLRLRMVSGLLVIGRGAGSGSFDWFLTAHDSPHPWLWEHDGVYSAIPADCAAAIARHQDGQNIIEMDMRSRVADCGSLVH